MSDGYFRNTLIYDGSFDGLLTAVYDAMADKIEVDAIISEEDNDQFQLADIRYNITSNATKSAYVAGRIRKTMSSEALETIYYVFKSSNINKGIIIFNAIKAGIRGNGKTVKNYISPEYAALNNLSSNVTGETHLLKGFVRFAHKKGDVYYAQISPEHDVIEFLAEYFADRMRDCKWIIHDYIRDKAAIGAYGKWTLTYAEVENIPADEDDEIIWQKCWRKFYNTIEIKERHNPKLRRRLMPYRYWRNMLEMQKQE